MFNARRPGNSSAVVLVSLASAVFAGACAPTASPDSTGVSAPTTSMVAVSSPDGAAAYHPGLSCPPPIQTDMACAAVMVSVKINGLCCSYGSPCAAPPGEQFSDDKCTQSNAIVPKKAPSAGVPPSSASGGATRTKPLPTRGQPCDLDNTPCAPGLRCFVEPMLPSRNGECR
jgi:hypothetical protein